MVKRKTLSKTSAANFVEIEGFLTKLKENRKQNRLKNMKHAPTHAMKTVAHFNPISAPSMTGINWAQDTMVSQPKKGPA